MDQIHEAHQVEKIQTIEIQGRFVIKDMKGTHCMLLIYRTANRLGSSKTVMWGKIQAIIDC